MPFTVPYATRRPSDTVKPPGNFLKAMAESKFGQVVAKSANPSKPGEKQAPSKGNCEAVNGSNAKQVINGNKHDTKTLVNGSCLAQKMNGEIAKHDVKPNSETKPLINGTLSEKKSSVVEVPAKKIPERKDSVEGRKSSVTSVEDNDEDPKSPRDVDKERNYNAFMENRLKLGQTKTVAEPLKKLKAVQQPETPPAPVRKNSKPFFLQTMLKKPKEKTSTFSPVDGDAKLSSETGTSSLDDRSKIEKPPANDIDVTSGSGEVSSLATSEQMIADSGTLTQGTKLSLKAGQASTDDSKPSYVMSTNSSPSGGGSDSSSKELGAKPKKKVVTTKKTASLSKVKANEKVAEQTADSETPASEEGVKNSMNAQKSTEGQIVVSSQNKGNVDVSTKENGAKVTSEKLEGIEKSKSNTTMNKQVGIKASSTVVSEISNLKTATHAAENVEKKTSNASLTNVSGVVSSASSFAPKVSPPPVKTGSIPSSQVTANGVKLSSLGKKEEGKPAVSATVPDKETLVPLENVSKTSQAPSFIATTTPSASKVNVCDKPSTNVPISLTVASEIAKATTTSATKINVCEKASMNVSTSQTVTSESAKATEQKSQASSIAKSESTLQEAKHLPKDTCQINQIQTVDIKDLGALLGRRTPSPNQPKTSYKRFQKRPSVLKERRAQSADPSKMAVEDLDDQSPTTSFSESTSGVSSMSGRSLSRRDSASSLKDGGPLTPPLRRPSSLYWDSDTFSSSIFSPCSDLDLRSRSMSVERSAENGLGRSMKGSTLPNMSANMWAHMMGGSSKYAFPALKGTNARWYSQVAELWSDLSQEQAAAGHASEMLDSESSERMRLEKEVRDLQTRCAQTQKERDRMEMEVMESRMIRSTELNGDLSDDEDINAVSVYRQKYEHAMRELELTKRKLKQQHEDELEQQILVKKATEKKLAEALDDMEEARQNVNQWKRKAQKLASELQDLKLVVEEHMSRNAELEKKQRRFDSDLNQAIEALKQEKFQKERIVKEKELLYAEKHSLDQELQSTRLEMELQQEKINNLHRELDELTFNSHAEEEVAKLKRAKQELERKSRDQEEELEDLAAQVQLLEQAKLRLEMALEKQRQEHKKELSVKEEEIEETRASASKKLKNMEALLESELEERHILSKQRNELERRLGELSERPPPRDPEIERRLRRDLKRTKALLQDAQTMIEHMKDGQANRSIVRQLKNQLEDAEFAKTVAVKARQGAEMELQEVQSQLEEVLRTKNESEGRCLQLSREKSALQTQLEELEEEQAEIMKKYKAAVQQTTNDQKLISEQSQQLLELETEKHQLKEQVQDMYSKMEHMSNQPVDSHALRRLESKVRDLESKLELELTAKTRLESQIGRLKEQCSRLQEECDQMTNKEHQMQENCRRLQRQLRELREDFSAAQQKEAESQQKCHELEIALENSEADLQQTKNDLKLACQRIQNLQNALEEDLDSGTDVAEDSESESDNDLDVDSMLRRHGLSPIPRKYSMSSDRSGLESPVLSRHSSRNSLLCSSIPVSRPNEGSVTGLSTVSPESEIAQSSNSQQHYVDEQLVDV